MIQYFYVALNERIGYTLNKKNWQLHGKKYWIRFLANYKQDKESDTLNELYKRKKVGKIIHRRNHDE